MQTRESKVYFVTKTYGHDLGLSSTFRQWRAKSHCRFLHGYALSFKFTFAATELDENGWVINFGGLKPVKAWLEDTFDHRMLIAADDPALDLLLEMGKARSVRRVDDVADWDEVGKLAQPIVLPAVGLEAFAKLAWDHVSEMLLDSGYAGRVTLTEVEVREHGANGVIYTGER